MKNTPGPRRGGVFGMENIILALYYPLLPRAEISSKYTPFNYQRLETAPVGTWCCGDKAMFSPGMHRTYFIHRRAHNIFIILRNLTYKSTYYEHQDIYTYYRCSLQLSILLSAIWLIIFINSIHFIKPLYLVFNILNHNRLMCLDWWLKAG